jgi:alkyl sulfatase BDS1-like metallo-beta-lactamase superfamily hydrolase
MWAEPRRVVNRAPTISPSAAWQAARGKLTLEQIQRAQHALLRLGRHAVDAHHELAARLQGDAETVSRVLELLDTIEQDVEIVRAIVRRLPAANEPREHP